MNHFCEPATPEFVLADNQVDKEKQYLDSMASVNQFSSVNHFSSIPERLT